MGEINGTASTAAKESARKECRRGLAARKSLADALGKNVTEITETDVVQAAKKGAARAGTDAMTASKTLESGACASAAACLTEVEGDVATAAGKISGGDCEIPATWHKNCMTKLEVRNMIDEQAHQCLLESQQACLEVRETLDGTDKENKNCKSNAQDMKTAVGTCTGYATEDLTDTKLGKMKAKATAGAVAKAMTTAREGGCAGDHADDAYKNCVETAVGEACKAAKGTVCSKKTIWPDICWGKRSARIFWGADISNTSAECPDLGGRTFETPH